MSFVSALRGVLRRGERDDPLARIRCPGPCFNQRSVIVTRDTLFRVSGFGATTHQRYLDDQVGSKITPL